MSEWAECWASSSMCFALVQLVNLPPILEPRQVLSTCIWRKLSFVNLIVLILNGQYIMLFCIVPRHKNIVFWKKYVFPALGFARTAKNLDQVQGMATNLDRNLNNEGKIGPAVGKDFSHWSVAFDSARLGGMVFALLWWRKRILNQSVDESAKTTRQSFGFRETNALQWFNKFIFYSVNSDVTRPVQFQTLPKEALDIRKVAMWSLVRQKIVLISAKKWWSLSIELMSWMI